MSIDVFLIDDDNDFRASLKQSLELGDLRVVDFDRPQSALQQLDEDFPGVIISDIKMTEMDGLEFLMLISEVDENIPVILISGHADVSTAVQAIQDGAYDLLEKPFRTRYLIEVCKRAQEKRRLVLENRRLRVQLSRHRNDLILGHSPVIRKLRDTITRHAPGDTNILISGELGTGKELVARSIHEQSARQKRGLFTLNCGSMPESELDIALFGAAEDGRAEAGLLRKSHAGTLYLEEIDQLPNRLAIKLLTLIQQTEAARRETRGSPDIDLRILASSHVPLEQLCQQGLFRDDLYYALSVLEIHVPPLRERSEDIPLLFRHFAAESSANYGVSEPAWSEHQIAELLSREWRGNLRALRHTAERWVLTGEAPHVAGPLPGEAYANPPSSLPDKIEQFEKMMIEQALEKHDGNVTRTHTELCIPRKTLYDKLQRHGIRPENFRNRGK